MGRSTSPRSPHDLLAVATRLDETVSELRRVVAWLVVEAHDRGATREEVGAAFDVTPRPCTRASGRTPGRSGAVTTADRERVTGDQGRDPVRTR